MFNERQYFFRFAVAVLLTVNVLIFLNLMGLAVVHDDGFLLLPFLVGLTAAGHRHIRLFTNSLQRRLRRL